MSAATAFAPLLASLKRQLDEDAGKLPARAGHGCPVCQRAVTVFYGRNSKAFLAIHHRMPCPRRYDTLGIGQTEEEALASIQLTQVIDRVENHCRERPRAKHHLPPSLPEEEPETDSGL